MNSFLKTTILCVTILSVLSCGGPKAGKPEQSQATKQAEQRDTLSTKKSSHPATPQSSVLSNDVTSGSHDILDRILLFLVIVEAGCIGWLIYKRERDYDVLIQRLKRHSTDIDKSSADITRIETVLSEIKSSNRQSISSTYKQEIPTKQGPIDVPEESDSMTKFEDTKSVFLKYFKDGILEEVASQEEALYEVTFEIDGKTGYFEFVGDERKAIKNKNSVLDDVCETKGYFKDATHIETKKWGECVKQSDGKWKVTKKAILSFK